jgi:hypothetical protein
LILRTFLALFFRMCCSGALVFKSEDRGNPRTQGLSSAFSENPCRVLHK